MADVKWTDEQQQVIDLRNRNILVSAAAGSGKTAVLVERIIKMISDENQPIDIDQLLIVTFTNAAAAEMRERISRAIEKKLNDMPDSIHLQKQMTLIHSAQITTIHSFCLNVVRNYFNFIELDPSFRVADEAELKLLKSDVISELLEDMYDKGDKEFHLFVESYSTGKTDASIEDMIIKLYEFSISYPWPEEWLTERRKMFEIKDLDEMSQSLWMKELYEYIHLLIEEAGKRNEEALSICAESDGPYYYMNALENDRELLEEIVKCNSYEEYGNIFQNISWTRLSSKKDASVSEEKKSEVKLIRDQVKKTVGDIKTAYFFQTSDEMLKDILATAAAMNVLISITMEFERRFSAIKREKNILDFNDLEHMALNILVCKEENGEISPTEAAEELKENYEEILIDEYQDSNLVQETILKSISRERDNNPNIFMVGDVKQSIYKFRLARPELFMEKYQSYSKEESSYQKIDLHKNFRSRNNVIDSINFIFEQIMQKNLGNINYDDDSALYCGAVFEDKDKTWEETEVILIDSDLDADESDLGNKELEAAVIASRIKELTDEENGISILDNGVYRRAKYNDIVILLRTMSGWADIFADTLMAAGIPAYSDTQTGYFSAVEIRTILDLLKIIDNPRQDIPLTAVLHSPIVGVTGEELSQIRSVNFKSDMYEAMLLFIEKGENEELVDKLNIFSDKLDKYREKISYMSINELILYVLNDTGYYNYVTVMPGGKRRRANIDMLIQKAVEYEGTSYRGLFNFNRYIEKLYKYDIDFGEAGIAGENENTIKIMSIHKSKGLEFPIVFASGMGKKFNTQDSKSRLVIHPDLGLGPDYVDSELRTKSPTLIKKVIQRKLILENLGEELRVLYVALTRAKEKLIMTGAVNKLSDCIVKWNDVKSLTTKELPFKKRSSASDYLDLIVPSLIRNKSFRDVMKKFDISMNTMNPLYDSNIPFRIYIADTASITENEVLDQVEKEIRKRELIDWDKDKIYNQKLRNDIDERLAFVYPYNEEMQIHGKMSVSELKKISYLQNMKEIDLEGEFEEKMEFVVKSDEVRKDIPIPDFIQGEKNVKGAVRGTLYHKVLECINLLKAVNKESLMIQIKDIAEKKKIKAEDLSLTDIDKLLEFLNSSLAKRMRKAQESGLLYKEKQFVMGIEAFRINKSVKNDDLILVQGIIDVYFEEEDGYVIMDYKTDRVDKEKGEAVLIERYKVQLDYYQEALEKITGKKVKERIIYSFGLGKEIIL